MTFYISLSIICLYITYASENTYENVQNINIQPVHELEFGIVAEKQSNEIQENHDIIHITKAVTVIFHIFFFIFYSIFHPRTFILMLRLLAKKYTQFPNENLASLKWRNL